MFKVADRMPWAWSLVLAVFMSLHVSHAQRCIHSGMCSLGRLKGFVGDISDSKGLKEAATARSWRKEVILHMTYAGNLLNTKLLLGNWAKLGIEHIMLMADSKEACAVVQRHMPSVGCAWDSFKPPLISQHYLAWHIRYRTMARLVRMGYNVLMSDTDIVVFDDPYRYFKHPPFNSFTIINQPEILSTYQGYQDIAEANGGLIYVQNARRDGVAAWLLAEVTDRFLRWSDDKYTLLKGKNISSEAGQMDQSALNDALSSVCTGFPHFLNTLKVATNNPNSDPVMTLRMKVTNEVGLTDMFVLGAFLIQFKAMFKNKVVNLTSRFMQTTANSNTTMLRYLDMVFPHTGGRWPEEYGGRWYPEKRGQLSEAFLKLLQDDCDGCPLWPDVENPATESAARAVPREQYLMAPPWLMSSYMARGVTGAWLPDRNGHIQQVIGHANYQPNTDIVSKGLFRQLVNQYDWATAEQHWSTPWVFQANMVQLQDMGDFTPLIEDQPSLPRLLVLHPRTRGQKLRTGQEYKEILHGAMQLAALSNRTLVWPDVPCNLSFVGKVGHRCGLFRPFIVAQWYPWGPSRGAEMKCSLSYLFNAPCLVDHRGMLEFEYEYLVQRYGSVLDLEAHRGNTAFYPVSSEVHSTLDTRQGPGSVLVQVTEQDARQHMQSLDRAQVVFLAHPVKVQGVNISQWQCLDDPNKLAMIGHPMLVPSRNSSAANVTVLPGRVVNGRLTTQEMPPAGLQGPATTNTVLTFKPRMPLTRNKTSAWSTPGLLEGRQCGIRSMAYVPVNRVQSAGSAAVSGDIPGVDLSHQGQGAARGEQGQAVAPEAGQSVNEDDFYALDQGGEWYVTSALDTGDARG